MNLDALVGLFSRLGKKEGSEKWEIKSPRSCDAATLASFIQMIKEGGEVTSSGLRERVGNAAFLGMYFVGGKLVGIAALKNPVSGYKAKVFQLAGVQDTGYNLELGWGYTKPEYRGRGISPKLCAGLMNKAGRERVFATTRADNAPMKKILGRLGFRQVGAPYQGSSGLLCLYVND